MTEYSNVKRAEIAAKKEGKSVPKSDMSWIDTVATDEDQDGVLRDVTSKLRFLNRMSTEHAFAIGLEFQRAKAIIPPKSFGKWLKPVSGYTVKAATYYISVHEKLADYKGRLIAAAIAPTTMFIMAKGSKSAIETALRAFENGERLTGRAVQAIIDAESDVAKTEQTPILLNTAGLAGLKKAAAARQIEEISLFRSMLDRIRSDVEEALKPLEHGRAVVKKHLADKIALDFRHAHDLLCSIAVPVKPGLFPYNNWTPGTFDKDTAWYKVQMLLFKAGNAEAWPDRIDFVPWLQNEVLPCLRFVLDDEPLPGFPLVEGNKADAAVDNVDRVGTSAETLERTEIPYAPSIDSSDLPEITVTRAPIEEIAANEITQST